MSTPPGPPPPTPPSPPPGFDRPAPQFPSAPSYQPPPPSAFARPFGVSLLAALDAFGGLLVLAGGALVVFASLASGTESSEPAGLVVGGLVGVMFALIGAFYLATAVGLWTLKSWGRTCQMILSVLGLLGFPLGTIISGLILYYLTRPGVKLLFSGYPPSALSPEDRALVDRDANQGAIIIVTVVVTLFGGVALIGIIAAIAIPSLLRARIAGNEASAIGALRSMSSAQAVWQSTHPGTYAEPACLGAPASCGDTLASGPYLQAEQASLAVRSGFRFGFVLRPAVVDTPPESARTHDPGTPAGETASDVPSDAQVQRQLEALASGAAVPPEGAPSQVAVPRTTAPQEVQPGGFVYWAVPEKPGVTGTRNFCLDETGVILVYVEVLPWTDPTPAEPRCPDGGRPLG